MNFKFWHWQVLDDEKREAKSRQTQVAKQELRVTASVERRQKIVKENNFGSNIKKAMGG